MNRLHKRVSPTILSCSEMTSTQGLAKRDPTDRSREWNNDSKILGLILRHVVVENISNLYFIRDLGIDVTTHSLCGIWLCTPFD